MSEPTLKATGPTLWDGRFRFGLKGLPATILVLALVFGWVGCENRRAQQQSILVAELVGVGVQPDLQEPTAVGFFVKKRFPSHEAWVRERIGEGWLLRPTVFLCSQLTDEQVPYAIERLQRLGTVREIHYQGRDLTERGLEKIRSSLPGVGVVPRANPALQRYFNSQVQGAHFALGGLMIEASLAIVLLGILASILWSLLSLARHRGSGARELKH
jgi:hypothetical protein